MRRLGTRGAVSRALAVLCGQFTAAEARAVAGATLHDLRGLMHASMLVREPAGRYAMHELGQFAAEKLAQDAAAAQLAQGEVADHGWQALEPARLCRLDALRVGPETRGFLATAFAVLAAALLLVDRGELEQAVELAAFAFRPV